MALIEGEILTRLTGGGLASGSRVFWDHAPEGPATPYVVLNTIGGGVLLEQAAPVTTKHLSFQVSVNGPTGSVVRNELATIRGRLHYWTGPTATHTVQRCIAEAESGVAYEEDAEIYRGHQDYELTYV